MHNLSLFLFGAGAGGGLAIVVASLPSVSIDWRLPALVLAISAGVLYGIYSARRPR